MTKVNGLVTVTSSTTLLFRARAWSRHRYDVLASRSDGMVNGDPSARNTNATKFVAVLMIVSSKVQGPGGKVSGDASHTNVGRRLKTTSLLLRSGDTRRTHDLTGSWAVF